MARPRIDPQTGEGFYERAEGWAILHRDGRVEYVTEDQYWNNEPEAEENESGLDE